MTQGQDLTSGFNESCGAGIQFSRGGHFFALFCKSVLYISDFNNMYTVSLPEHVTKPNLIEFDGDIRLRFIDFDDEPVLLRYQIYSVLLDGSGFRKEPDTHYSGY